MWLASAAALSVSVGVAAANLGVSAGRTQEPVSADSYISRNARLICIWLQGRWQRSAVSPVTTLHAQTRDVHT